MQQRQESGTRLDLRVRNETETARVAQAVARAVDSGDVIALHGDLGSGKTAFARSFVRTLMAEDEEVPSPTFTLVQTYPAEAATIYHFDFYRIEDPDEAWEIGIEEAFAEGISLIEWPERLGGLLPGDRLDVFLTTAAGMAETERGITLAAGPAWRDRLVKLQSELEAFRDV
jgi:tRNA threonylcarbamoyladenosine biosynthesis protein TsaE